MSLPADPGAELATEARALLAAAADRAIRVRLMGGIAIRLRCPGQVETLRRFARHYSDFDVVAAGGDVPRLRTVIRELGYVEDPHVYVDSAGSRMIAFRDRPPGHFDVFLDDLRFCHTISLKGRLDLAAETLPLADLLLQKLQIVELNRKDLVDLVVLLLEHEVGDDDASSINAERVAGLTSEDWGLWRTVTMNLDRLEEFASTATELGDDDRGLLPRRVAELRARIDACPKGLRWRIRAKVGDRVRWYEDVEDLHAEEGHLPVSPGRSESGHGTA